MLKMSLLCVAVFLAAAGPAPAQPAPSTAAPPAPAAGAAANPGSDQFASEQTAKSHCPDDTVVWANLGGSKAYHLSGDRYYGKTKHGAYMCRKDADQSGLHTAGRRSHKSTAKSPAAKTTQ